MKINFQKIFIVISAVCVICCFAVPASADTSSVDGGINSGGGGQGGQRTTYGNGVELFIEAVIDFSNGDITYDQYTSRSAEIIGDYMTEYTDRAGLAFMAEINGKISETVAKYALDAPMYVSDWINDIISDYETQEEVSTTDKKGYQSVYIKTTKSSTGKTIKEYTYFNGYIICYPKDTGYNSYLAVLDDGTCYYAKYSDGVLDDDVSGYQTEWSDFQSTETSKVDIAVYGDVRYSDGSEAPTDDEFETKSIIKLDDLTDSELEEVLEDINEELERQNPDLSTIEGLLSAIYYRLGSLDSDNDNELLSQVLTAIQALEMTDNTELINILNDIKDSLTDGNDNTEDENEELTDELEKHLTVGDFVIDEDMYRNYSEVLKLRLQEKFIFADQLKELITYTVNSYSNSSENPQLSLSYDGNTYSMDFSAFNEHIPAIRFIIAAFTYITFAFRTYRKIPSYINGGDNL